MGLHILRILGSENSGMNFHNQGGGGVLPSGRLIGYVPLDVVAFSRLD